MRGGNALVVKRDDDTQDRHAELLRLIMELDRIEESLRDTHSLDECERKIDELRRKINDYLLLRLID
jgi:hypothetical protein